MYYSVIVPVRNAVNTVESALLSALSQSDGRGQTLVGELIVVDDGSSDGTSEVLAILAAADRRVKVLRSEHSQGVSASRNRAIQIAQGEWIAVLDADDEFLPERLSRMQDEAENRLLDILADNLQLRSDSGDHLGLAFDESQLSCREPISLEDFVAQDFPHRQHMGIGYCKPIIRRKFLVDNQIGYDPAIGCAEDFLLYSQSIISGARMGFVNFAGYLYTVRKNDHGTAFNLQVSEVNRLIFKSAAQSMPLALPILAERQRAIDMDALSKSIRARRLAESLISARRLPLSLVLSVGLRSALLWFRRSVLQQRS